MNKGENNKGTNIEINNRIAVVAEMIIKGYSRENILRYSAENWTIKERQTDEYIKLAHERFVDEAKAKDIEHHLNLVIQQLNDLYKKSYAIQDYAECRRIKKDIADLLGLQAPKKTDLTSNGKEINGRPIINFTNGNKPKREDSGTLDNG